MVIRFFDSESSLHFPGSEQSLDFWTQSNHYISGFRTFITIPWLKIIIKFSNSEVKIVPISLEVQVSSKSVCFFVTNGHFWILNTSCFGPTECSEISLILCALRKIMYYCTHLWPNTHQIKSIVINIR